MSQAAVIVVALKQILKEARVTYRDIAKALDMSEASIKRMFASHQFSLQRLDRICELAGVEISDLMRRVESERQIIQLTREQEEELVADTKLLLVAISVVNQVSFTDILATYTYTETELIRYMAKLDRIKLIEFLPGNRAKPLISPDFHWIKNGPIQRYFESEVQAGFMNARFDRPGELRLFLTGMLSTEANQQMQQKLKRLALDFRHLRQEDVNKALPERHGTSLVLAMRPWEPPAFAEFRRPGTEKIFPS